MASSLTLLEMKQQVEADLRIPVNSMKLVFKGQEMTAPNLSDYEMSKTEKNQIELRIVYMEEHPPPSSYTMPDTISVEVEFGVDIPPKLIQAGQLSA